LQLFTYFQREVAVTRSKLSMNKRLRYPTTEQWRQVAEFNNCNRKERVPFVVYAHLEYILEKTDNEEIWSGSIYAHNIIIKYLA